MTLFRRRRWPSVPLIVAVLAGCTDSKPGQSDAVVPRWSGTTELSIAGTETAGFSSVSGVAADARGRVYVAEAERGTVSGFDSGGRFLFHLGEPGGFKTPCCLAVGPGGDVWFRETGNARYHRFVAGDSGAALRETRAGAAAAGALRSELTFDAAGRLIDVVVRPALDGQTRMLRFHLDSAGGAPVATDTIVAPPGDSLGVHQVAMGNNSFGFISQPFGPRLLVAHAPGGGWARAVSSRYLVQWQTADGGSRQIRRDMIGPALSARERREADSVLQAQVARVGEAAGRVPFGVPGSKTPITGLLFDQQGRLWVQLNVGDGEVNRADVWDASGQRVGNAEWPAGVDLRPGFISEHLAYGVTTDSSAIQRVVRVRFQTRR